MEIRLNERKLHLRYVMSPSEPFSALTIACSDPVDNDMRQFTCRFEQSYVTDIRCAKNADFQRIGLFVPLFGVTAEKCPETSDECHLKRDQAVKDEISEGEYEKIARDSQQDDGH